MPPRRGRGRRGAAEPEDRVDRIERILEGLVQVVHDVHNNNNHDDAPQQPAMPMPGAGAMPRTTIKQFQQLRPPTFYGTPDPRAAESWLLGIQRVFEVLPCTDEQKVARRFEAGLRWNIKNKVEILRLPTHQEVLHAALIAEESLNEMSQFRENRKKRIGGNVSRGQSSKRQSSGSSSGNSSAQQGNIVIQQPPTERGNNQPRQGRAFALVPGNTPATTSVVSGILPICGQPAHILMDSGSTHSFVSHSFEHYLTTSPVSLEYELSVSLPSGDSMLCDRVYSSCEIRVNDVPMNGSEEIARRVRDQIRLYNGPEEIVFFILVRLPADILYNSAQYVCWQWYSIIHNPYFIYEHLRRSTSGLFIQYVMVPCTPCFAELGKTNATVTEVSFPFPIEALATCDGLVLFRDRQNMDDLVLFTDRRKRTIRVANPLIKKVATVPPLTVQGYHYSYFSLACTRSRREYKVVFAYGSNLRFEDFDCMVVTLGKDHAWKLINNSTKFPSSCPKLFCYRPLSKGGFLYWAHFDLPFVVTLDVESEMCFMNFLAQQHFVREDILPLII
ncbi:hypothetical protein Acr_15g0005220 [Actinidia rufa]|uniref:F-box domain-containing protein n=1 Tax=Actinidia rufa TaxID=165716 RepID=A0A7J0FT95_9ERIC|nr:hypothetical protein Acr_15g0005220 [Actinidia rufa]